MIATAARVLWQIRRDPRTIVLLLGVPVGLLTLLRYVFDSELSVFKKVGAPMCGLFPFILMFLVTSITMLRERTTIPRTTPILRTILWPARSLVVATSMQHVLSVRNPAL